MEHAMDKACSMNGGEEGHLGYLWESQKEKAR
jgi:hypothetical protein